MFLRLSRPNSAIVFFSMFYLTLFLSPANEVWGKVIFSVACVKNSVHRGSVSVHAGIPYPPGPGTPPLEQTPFWSRHPQEQAPPGTRYPSPRSRHPPPRDQAHPPGADPPGSRPHLRSACWEIRSTSGRYASYWNAILL